jgi:hypothetical protein
MEHSKKDAVFFRRNPKELTVHFGTQKHSVTFVAPLFNTNSRTFPKTGSGQTWENSTQKRALPF